VYADSAEPDIAGKRVAQVPKVQTSVAVRVNAPLGVLAVGQLRYTGTQFDDDLNRFLLSSATIVDFSASRAMGAGIQIFGAVENVSNADYDVGRTPTRTIGLPRTIRGGIRWTIR
jgi:outer membrane receptor protein involved in Fe transport